MIYGQLSPQLLCSRETALEKLGDWYGVWRAKGSLFSFVTIGGKHKETIDLPYHFFLAMKSHRLALFQRGDFDEGYLWNGVLVDWGRMALWCPN
jgi:hypothetical protein